MARKVKTEKHDFRRRAMSLVLEKVLKLDEKIKPDRWNAEDKMHAFAKMLLMGVAAEISALAEDE